GACDGGDKPGWGHLADAVVVRVGDEEIARRVHRQTPWGRELGGSCRTPISAKVICSGARNGGDDAGRVHLADAVVLSVGDEQIPCRVHLHTPWGPELSGGRRAAVSAEASCSAARNGGDDPGWGHLA